jgi:hypothetical protein
MSNTVTISFTLPVELSIQLDLYMEANHLNRSQVIKAALSAYLYGQQKKDETPDLLEKIYAELLEIKSRV